MENSNAVLSTPLQQLMDEHVLLRSDMDILNEIAEEIEFESGSYVIQLFGNLYKRILIFNEKLKAHSRREEEGLFRMIAYHLKEKDKIIQEMEYEHEKAEKHLQDFLTEAEQAGLTVDEYNAQSITVYAVQAFATLIQHFAKEEKSLFPMAESLLSLEEKEELEHFFQD